MARFSTAMIGLLWAATFIRPASGTDELPPAVGLQYLKAASEIVATCDVAYRVEISWNLVAVKDDSTGVIKMRRHFPSEVSRRETYLYRLISDREKYRYELFNPGSGKLEAVCVIIKADWRYKEFVGRTGPSFTVRQKTSPPGGSWRDYREFLGTHFSEYPLHHLLSERNAIRASRDHEGRVILEVDPEPDRLISGSLNGYRVVMNPKRGLMAEELVGYYKGLPEHKNEVIEWHEFAKGAFAPVKMRITSYQPANREFPGQVYCVHDMIVDVSRSSWNRPVDPGLFELHADSGMPVVDSVKGVMTMGGKAKPGENIDELANQPIKFQSGPPPETNDWLKKPWPWTTVGASSAALMLVAGGLWWRFGRTG